MGTSRAVVAVISRETIEGKIHLTRGYKVMLGKDLAEFYGIAKCDTCRNG